MPKSRRVGINPFVRDGQFWPAEPKGEGALLDQLELVGLGPALLRPPPPLLDSREDDVLWLNPHSDGSFDIMWDHSMCADNIQGAEVRELMGKACRGLLVPAQQQQVPEPTVSPILEVLAVSTFPGSSQISKCSPLCLPQPDAPRFVLPPTTSSQPSMPLPISLSAVLTQLDAACPSSSSSVFFPHCAQRSFWNSTAMPSLSIIAGLRRGGFLN